MSDVTYRNSRESVADRVADLTGRMTLEEKTAQLGAVWVTELVENDAFAADTARRKLADGIGQVTRIGASTGLRADQSAQLMNEIQRVCVEETRLGIPVIVHEEAVAGFCARGATTFPQALGLAATFDPDLVAAIAEVIRVQMLAVGARHALSPVLDIARDPRWGRVEETYGESVELASRMAVAYVRGLQTDDLADGVVCTGKHFLGYGAPTGGRNHAPVHVGPRELRDVYAAPFAAAIREAGLASIMNSYSAVDGRPCAGSPEILTELLRDELGFDGVVVADYFAVMQLEADHRTAADRGHAAAQALSAGLDVELPALDCYREIPEMVRSGRLDERLVDTALERVLAQKFALGLFERPYVEATEALTVYDTADQRALARSAATAGICLLTNDGTLPLRSARLSRVAVIGPAADDRRLLQGDYHYPTHLEVFFANPALGSDTPAGANVDQLPEAGGSFAPGPYFTDHVTPLAGLRRVLGPEVDVVHERGCSDTDPADTDFERAVAAAGGADVAVVVVGARSGLTSNATVGEARDAVSLDLPGAQTGLVEAVAATGTPTVVVVVSGRVHTLVREAEAASALCWAFLPGEEGGNAIADVLTGAVSPSARLPVTLPRHVGQVPLHHDLLARGDRSEFYRDYVDSPVSPLFAFGHGLSYTSFEYDSLRVDPGSTTEPTAVTVSVANRGGCDGDEIVQLYARDDVGSVVRPIRELVGFTRVTLAPGERRTVTFTVHPSRLAFHDAQVRLVCEPGSFTFSVGGASDQLALHDTVELSGAVAQFRIPDVVPTRVALH